MILSLSLVQILFYFTYKFFSIHSVAVLLLRASAFCHRQMKSVWKCFFAEENFCFRFFFFNCVIFCYLFFFFHFLIEYIDVGVVQWTLFYMFVENIVWSNFVPFQTRDNRCNLTDKRHTRATQKRNNFCKFPQTRENLFFFYENIQINIQTNWCWVVWHKIFSDFLSNKTSDLLFSLDTVVGNRRI